MSKTYYHGTVDIFLADIKKHGLVPSIHTKNAWHIQTVLGPVEDDETPNAVYVTPTERRAIEYAETRVRYFAAKPGGKFKMFDFVDVSFTKEKDQPVIEAKPILLVIELPEEDDLEEDPDDPGSYMHDGPIPFAWIKEVRPLGADIKDMHKKDRDVYPEQVAAQDAYEAEIMRNLSAMFGNGDGDL